MPHEFPPFRPENYPRTYKTAIESAIFAYLWGGLTVVVSIPFLVVSIVKHHGVDVNFFLSDDCLTLVLIFGGLLLILSGACTRLTLTADAIRHRSLFSCFFARTMKRADIKGVRYVMVAAGKYSTSDTVFIAKDPDGKSMTVPTDFRLDDFFDAWIGSLPFLGGQFGSQFLTEKDMDKLTWNAYAHFWVLRNPGDP